MVDVSAEWALVIATVGLIAATVALVYATFKLVQATKSLADQAAQQTRILESQETRELVREGMPGRKGD